MTLDELIREGDRIIRERQALIESLEREGFNGEKYARFQALGHEFQVKKALFERDERGGLDA